MPHALLATHHFVRWSGSEIVLVEFGEALAARGFEITLLAPFIDQGFVAEAVPGWRVLSDPQHVDLSLYDLAYCQHQVLSASIAENVDVVLDPRARPFFVYNHLSGLEPFEMPGPFVEADVADLIWCQAPRTRKVLLELCGPAFRRTRIVPNPSPRAFVRNAEPPTPLKRLLSVSNHRPPELLSAFEILERDGVEVSFIGGNKNQRRRLQPADIAASDAVVTIGKTVQFALLSRRPVFIYDHFGGGGWLDTAEELNRAGYINFSGLDQPRSLTAEEIAASVQSGYRQAEAFTKGVGQGRLRRYVWDDYIDELLARLEQHRENPEPIVGVRERGLRQEALHRRWRHEALLYGLIDRHYKAQVTLGARNEQLKRQVQQLRTTVGTLQADHENPR